MTNRFVFVASPYSHPDAEVRTKRYEAACRAAIVFTEFDVPVYVPIAMTGRFEAPDIPYQRWLEHSTRMLAHSAAVVVLTLDGWEESKGIQTELEIARLRNLPVEMVSLDGLRDYLICHAERLRRLCDESEGKSSFVDRFASGAVRDSRRGKGRFDLLPPNAVKRWALRLELGAIRYSENNYLKGMPLSRILDSGLRHAFAYLSGDDSEDHLGALIWNAGAAAEIETRCLHGILSPEFLDVGPAQRRDWTVQDFSNEKRLA